MFVNNTTWRWQKICQTKLTKILACFEFVICIFSDLSLNVRLKLHKTRYQLVLWVVKFNNFTKATHNLPRSIPAKGTIRLWNYCLKYPKTIFPVSSNTNSVFEITFTHEKVNCIQENIKCFMHLRTTIEFKLLAQQFDIQITPRFVKFCLVRKQPFFSFL